jgi:hypothetical protein
VQGVNNVTRKTVRPMVAIRRGTTILPSSDGNDRRFGGFIGQQRRDAWIRMPDAQT